MSRTQKLYARLDECERQYLLLAQQEFELLMAGTVGTMNTFALANAGPHDPIKAAHFNWLEKEVHSLREKLREPIQGSVVWIVERFRRQYTDLGVKQRPEIWIHRCKETLLDLNMLAESSPAPPYL